MTIPAALSPSPGTRERVLASALRLFVRRGYFNTSIPDVVRDSGVSVGSIYHHFGGKQELAAALYRETMDAFVRRMSERASGQATVEGKLRALTELLYEACEAAPDEMEYMLFVRHGEVVPDEVPVCLSAPFRTVAEWVEQGMRTGEVAQAPPDLAAGVFLGGVLKVMELRLRGKVPPPLPRAAPEAFALAWRAIASPR